MSEEAKPIGFTSQRFTAIDLAREIGALNGHVLRASRTRISPGGGYASHAHNGRPEIIVMLKGTLTETRKDRKSTRLNSVTLESRMPSSA